MRRFLCLTLIFISSYFCFAKTVSFKTENYSGLITYNEKASVGDAVFARLSIKTAKVQKKKSASETQAVLQLFRGAKKIDSAQFYFTQPKSKKSDMMASIPISLWTKADDEYSLKIIFSLGDKNDKEVLLPFDVEKKEFFSEMLDLDEKNSKIKQDNSAERMKQIEKLNNILQTVSVQDVFSLKPFVRPVKSERMTAHFGDKRIYKYTNGKTENNYHYGHDYGVPEKTEVYACGEGKVVMAENRITTGWSVVIEHLPGLYSLYYHLSEPLVKEGDNVRQGQKIGLSGSTGLATGPHLHWEVRLNMAAVSPDFFIGDFTFNDEK